MAMIGGILGFLRYNSHPARVFMGDSGSQVLGFTLGFLAIYLTQVAHTAVSAALPLLLVGLPVADILVVLYQRARGGGNWFLATRNHVHHRLLQLGLSHYETVIIIYSIHTALVVGAVLLRYASDWVVALLYVGIIGALFAALAAGEAGGWRVRRAAARSPVEAAIDRLAAGPLLRRIPLGVISALVPGVMLFGAVWVARVPRDFAIAALVLAAVVAAELLRPRASHSLVSRLAVYAAAIFSAYLLIIYPRAGDSPVQTLTLVIMLVLAGAIAVYVRFAARPAFGTTPTDYLVVFGLIALLAFGAVDTQSRAIVEMVAYATVLLYGCEVVLGLERRWPLLHVSTLATLAILAFRGVV
jgi:UDP-GlcNAc:undecaprenyl-phosphate GlcNAc-1-phosphate transferase